jgi:hypothetical protein
MTTSTKFSNAAAEFFTNILDPGDAIGTKPHGTTLIHRDKQGNIGVLTFGNLYIPLPRNSQN